MHSHILLNRLRKELADLEKDPPPGIVCYPVDDDITHLESYIKGPPDSPYEKGMFKLEIKVPHTYPFDPPQIHFRTRIYHPNIDEAGRICADILKKGEHGGWKPSLNLSTTLISLSALMALPNPDDPLDADIAKEYQLNYEFFISKAKEYTAKYATDESSSTSERSQDNAETEKTATYDQKDEPMITIDTSSHAESSSSTKSRLSLSTKKRKANSAVASAQKRQREDDSVAATSLTSTPISSLASSTSKQAQLADSGGLQQNHQTSCNEQRLSSVLSSSAHSSSNHPTKVIDKDARKVTELAKSKNESLSQQEPKTSTCDKSSDDSDKILASTNESVRPAPTAPASPIINANETSTESSSQLINIKSSQSSKIDVKDAMSTTPSDTVSKTTQEIPSQAVAIQEEQLTAPAPEQSLSLDKAKEQKTVHQSGVDVSKEDHLKTDIATTVSSQERWNTVLQEIQPTIVHSGERSMGQPKKPRPKLSLSKSKKQKAQSS